MSGYKYLYNSEIRIENLNEHRRSALISKRSQGQPPYTGELLALAESWGGGLLATARKFLTPDRGPLKTFQLFGLSKIANIEIFNSIVV